MSIRFDYSNSIPVDQDTLVITLFEDLEFGTDGEHIDNECGQLISQVLKRQNKFKGKKGQTLTISTPDNIPYSRVVLLGIGRSHDDEESVSSDDDLTGF